MKILDIVQLVNYPMGCKVRSLLHGKKLTGIIVERALGELTQKYLYRVKFDNNEGNDFWWFFLDDLDIL